MEREPGSAFVVWIDRVEGGQPAGVAERLADSARIAFEGIRDLENFLVLPPAKPHEPPEPTGQAKPTGQAETEEEPC